MRIVRGESASPKEIKRYYANLVSSGNDSLFFNYAGHGGAEGADEFMVTQRGTISRADVMKLMESWPHGLVVLLNEPCGDLVSTDCHAIDRLLWPWG